MKNILIYTNLYPNPAEPIRGNFIEPIVRRLAKNNRVTVISPVPWLPKSRLLKRFKNYPSFDNVPHFLGQGNIAVYYPRYYIIPKTGATHSFSLFLCTISLIKRLHADSPFDLINAHWLFPDGVAATWIAKRFGIPLVVSARGCDANHYMKMPLRRAQIIRALNHANGVTVVSKALKAELIRYGIDPDKIRFIPNGVSLGKFSPKNRVHCRKTLGISKDTKVILFIGQLLPVKGISTLLEAVLRLKERGRVFKLIMVGEGALEKRIRLFIEQNRLSEFITLTGRVPHSEIPLHLGASNLLCLPSVREGRPNVVIEAIASGRPVVASSVGGIPELVNEDSGILVLPNNPAALSTAIDDALERKWDTNTIRNSIEVIDWERSTLLYEQFFREVRDKVR